MRALVALSVRDGAGSNGPIGVGGLMLDGGGCDDWETKSRAGWPQLLAGRRKQRQAEPEIAHARDLAEAYHYLDYYGQWRADRSSARSPARSSTSAAIRCS